MVVPPRPTNPLPTAQSRLSFNGLSVHIGQEEMHANQDDAPKLIVEPHPHVWYKVISDGFFSGKGVEFPNAHRTNPGPLAVVSFKRQMVVRHLPVREIERLSIWSQL